MKYLLLILLPLTGCFGPRIPKLTVPEDVNVFVVAAHWTAYAGIGCILIGLAMLVFMKMIKTGGLSIITGVACLASAVALNYIGAHLQTFVIAAIVLTGLIGFLYYKALTTSVPLLEKIFGDINRNGRIDETPSVSGYGE